MLFRSRPPGIGEETGPASTLWALIEEYDLVNEIPGGIGDSGNDRSLGRNTGLEPARYVPVCLANPEFAGLAEATQAFVDADVNNEHLTRPPLRGSDGAVLPGMEPFIRWEYAPTVLDTFFDVASRAGAPLPDRVIPKRGLTYYHYIDHPVPNGFESYYAVVAADHLVEWDGSRYQPAGYGVQSDPGNNQAAVVPAPLAQTAEQRAREGVNIYVYPNPATRQALDEFQRQPASPASPTGVRTMFNNLPLANNRITIYTASGDLVATIDHDGHHDGGAASWNLISRNRQEVASGIYLYVVESDDARFEPFRGRFVVVR